MTAEGTPKRRRAGRPKQNVLSPRLIHETALRLIDRHGVDGAGMRAIAAELGVRPSSLYNHVAGQHELIAGVRDLVSERIPTEPFADRPWDEALELWARGYRLAFASHPPTIALLAVQPLTGDSATSFMYDTVAAALVRAGWPEERALSVIVAFECFILGAALDLAADPTMLDPGRRDDVPAFSGAYRARGAALDASGASPADDAFEIGLRAMLAGLRAEYALLGTESPVASPREARAEAPGEAPGEALGGARR
ncbi:TetR/AcrR family transcriptional regulator [Leucobacter chromiiresistens]|uniref:TetR/AcrR family transcriptional regulator n=1 Tax=Leucobacter chromiiresistens TaxID=1079994 RepID=UPI0009E7BB8D|nr:TetR/AcrR family transcriptional regulator C-terminal domain-containing protein [Leucobacter chromiiresistens]